MKSLTLYSLLVAGTAQAALIPPTSNERVDWRYEQKRQILGTLTWLIGKGGRVADPPGATSKRVEMKSPSLVPGVRRVKMRYGPYSVPNMNKSSIVGEPGSLWNYPDTNIPKPCTECTIVTQQAGLEYADGKNANIDTGMWLHHMVHITIGAGRQDPTCYGRASLPHADVGASPGNSERYFSSGNERTHVTIDKLGAATKFGYHLRPQDRFAFIVDLMNMNMEDKTVYLTMTYDLLDGPLPAGWRDVKVVWFDANQCGTSEVNPPKQSGKFVISSGTWKPNFDGEILGVGGHMHDGGESVKVQVSGEVNCNTVAKYAETSEYKFGGMKMGAAGGVATNHISSINACYFEEMKVRQLSPDQVWQIKGHYDYDTFEGNKDEHGKQESIMAIALMYVAINPGTQLRGSAAGAPKAAGAPAAGTATGGSRVPPRQPKGLPAPKASAAPQPAAAAPAAPASGHAGMAGMKDMDMKE